jgi:hypothetical protein
VSHICIYIYRICDSICTYFKQLEGFVRGAYAITFSIYVNANAAHTYPYYIFYLNGPLKLIILDLVYCSEHIFPPTLSLQ